MRWGALKVLRDRNAALYLSGVIVSGFGNTAMMLAAGVWVKTLTGSNSLAALVGFCLWAPTIAEPALALCHGSDNHAILPSSWAYASIVLPGGSL